MRILRGRQERAEEKKVEERGELPFLSYFSSLLCLFLFHSFVSPPQNVFFHSSLLLRRYFVLPCLNRRRRISSSFSYFLGASCDLINACTNKLFLNKPESFRRPASLGYVPQTIKDSASLAVFKNKIKSWSGATSHCQYVKLLFEA